MQQYVYYIKCDMVKPRWFFWSLQMCHWIIPDVNFSQAFSVIIDHSISATGHYIEVVDGLKLFTNGFFSNKSNCETYGCKTLWHINGYAH